MALELKRSTGFTIDALTKMDDAALLDTLGYVNKLDDFKTSLKEADGLKGKAREEVERKLNEMLSPRMYPDDLKYAIDAVKRKNRSGKDALGDDSPVSVLD